METRLYPSDAVTNLMWFCIFVQVPLFFYLGELPLFIAYLAALSNITGIIAILAYRRSRNKAQLKINSDAEILSKSDSYFLYLRPFVTSGRLPVPCQLPSMAHRWIMGPAWDVELALSLAMSDRSAMMAVGQTAGSFGAAKLVVNDSAWQSTVLDLAKRATVIAIVPLPRPATLWEVRQIFADPELLSKTVLVMPPTSFGSLIVSTLLPWRHSPWFMWRKSRRLLAAEGIEIPPYRRLGGFAIYAGGRLHFFQARLFRPSYVSEIFEIVGKRAGTSPLSLDDIEDARKLESSYSNWRRPLEYLGYSPKAAIYGLLIALFIRAFLFQPFSIPSGAMRPTLLEGDYLFATKWAYGYSRHSLPLSPDIFSGRFWGSPPERGDVAVFKFPPNPSLDYIMRVIGLPGDLIQMRGGEVYINNQAMPRVKVGEIADFDITEADRPVDHYRETLPNGASYDILELTQGSIGDDTGEFVVPPGHYFTMGDNRDNANDSRFTVGFVPEENLVGRAGIIFFSMADGASPLEIWKWPRSLRFRRLGHMVR